MAIANEVVMHDEQLDKKKIKLIGFISFLSGFSQAIIFYVTSYYFELSSGTKNVGIFYTLTYIVVLLLFFNLHKVVRKLGKSNVLYLSLLCKIAAVFGLTMVNPSVSGIVLMASYILFYALEWTSIDIILESFSEDKLSGRIRGIHLTVFNAGLLLGPFLSTQILERFNYGGIFTFALVLNIIIFSIALVGLRNVNHRFEQKLKTLELIKKVFRMKDVLRIYYVSFVLESFFALMVIYTPLYLLDLGLRWEDIGIAFTIMLVPFVIFQYPAGLLADKKMGEKEMIIVSLIFMAVSTLGIYFIETKSVLFWGMALFATRIGAALIEVLRDSYFYKKIDGHDVDLISFMRTSMPVGFIFSTVLSTFIIFFFSIKIAFILVAGIVLSALYPALKLNDNKSEKELLQNA